MAKRIKDEANNLKEIGVGNRGAVRIASVDFRLEALGRDGHLTGGDKALEELTEEIARLKDFIGNTEWIGSAESHY